MKYGLIAGNGRFPVLIVIAGVEGAGKSETVNLLNEWMDPRHIATSAFGDPSDEERERPAQWRFWRALPSKGRIGIFFGGWHTDPILNRVLGRISDAGLARDVGEILRLEKMLADEGVLLLKYWFHLSRKQQEKRLKALEGDPRTRWHVTDVEWKYFALHKKFVKVCDPFLRKTSTGESPWIVVPGADPRYRTLTMGRHLLAAMRERLDEKPLKRLASSYCGGPPGWRCTTGPAGDRTVSSSGPAMWSRRRSSCPGPAGRASATPGWWRRRSICGRG